jgi:Tfp pilus assembly protein PilE
MLTVVMIVGVLTAIALPQYRRAIQKSQATEAVGMLRVILDSSERLAAEMGYRDFNAMADSPDHSKAVFSRLDMFDKSTTPCSFDAREVVMTCKTYTYQLNPGSVYISATKRTDPNRGTEIRIYRYDIPEYKCCGTGCEVFNIDADTGCGD